MVVERETIVERPVERETVVTGGGGGGAALLGGIVIAAILALLFFWIFNGDRNGTVKVELPAVTEQSK